MSKKHNSMIPRKILDVDNGLDFTFDGLGLEGNRPRKFTFYVKRFFIFRWRAIKYFATKTRRRFQKQ